MNSKIKVLCVDDNERWQNTVSEIISMLGYEVDFASTSQQARAKLKRSTYHVALLDKRLDENDPDNDEGLNIAKHIAELDEGTKIVVYTAFGEVDDAIAAFRDINVDNFIKKVEPLPKIKAALEKSAAKAELEFNRPARMASEILATDTKAVDQFLLSLPSKADRSSYAQDLNRFAKRFLGKYRPLLPDRKDAEFIKVNKIPILKIRFWSKMLGFPIVTWFGKFKELKALMENVEENDTLRSSLGMNHKLDELFDYISFPDFGGVIFELEHAEIDEFTSKPEIRA